MAERRKMQHQSRRDTTERAFDQRLGAFIRYRRTLLGLTQTELGKLLGISFQQIQRYERGSHAINLSRLPRLASALETTPQELLAHALGWRPQQPQQAHDLQTKIVDLQALEGLPPSLRTSIRALAKAVAESKAADGKPTRHSVDRSASHA